MSDRAAPDQGVMEGGGAYNRHSMLQAAGIALALPLLEKAMLNVKLEADSHPIVIADYGSSEGKNSLAPMRLVIETIRRRTDPKRPILVFHIDQPANDFNSLFGLLNTDPASYALGPDVFSCAIGRSFYDKVLPPGYVHLGGPRSRPIGSAKSRRQFLITSFQQPAVAPHEQSLSGKVRRTGKLSFRCAHTNCSLEAA